MGDNDTGVRQRSAKGVEPVRFATSHKALSHMIPRGSLTATVLTEGETLLEGSTDLQVPHQANGRAILPSNQGGGNFSPRELYLKNVQVIKLYLKRIWRLS